MEVIPPGALCDALRDATPADFVQPYSASPRYFLAVADALQSNPLPLRVTDGEGCTSVVLGRLRREPQLARIGYLRVPLPPLLTYTVIYQGIVGCCEAGAMVHALDRWLRSEYRVEQIVFTKQCAGSEIDQALGGFQRATALSTEPHWRLELPETFEALMSRHSGKHRQRLRWERRKLEESLGQPLVHAILGTSDEVEAILECCETLGRSTYHARVGGMVRRDHVWRAVLGTLAESDALACHLFRAGQDAIAFVLTARREQTTHVIAMAHLPEHGRHSPGKHLLLEVLRDSCDRRMRWVDYGFGDAQYKQVYGSHCAHERTLLLSAPTLRATVVRHAIRAAAVTHNAVQRAVGSRLAGLIKRRWRGWLRASSAHHMEQT